MGKLFSIGEASRIKGITKKALRFYERIGLLKPSHRDPDNGYRFYSVEQFVVMDIIKAMRAMDVSPLDIRTVLQKRDSESLLDFLDTQRDRAARKIEALKRIVGNIEGVRDAIVTSRASVSRAGIYRRRIAERTIVTLPFEGIHDSDDAAVAFSRFDGILEKHGLVNTYETGVLFTEKEGVTVPSRIFNIVYAPEGSDKSMTRTLPAGDYLCTWYTEKNAAEKSAKITRYCARHGIQPALVLQKELLNDVFATTLPAMELQLLME